jgi:hypothetical protein
MLAAMTILLAVVLAFLFIEYTIHIRNLDSISVRIHVNGTRGKSSVTRLIAGALREHGMRTFGKTPGTLPRMIMDDGREYPIYRPTGADVNVGGGTVSVGAAVGKRLFNPGLNRRAPPGALSIDGILSRFAREGVPVIHMVHTKKLIEKFGLPASPSVIPEVAERQIFFKAAYNLYLAAASLLILLFVLYAFLKLDIGYRIFGSRRIVQTPRHPEPMV